MFEININKYIKTLREPNIINFKKNDKNECRITAIIYNKNNIKIDYWVSECEEKGTGRIIMKDFLEYLLSNTVEKDTNVLVTIDANQVPNSRITVRDDEKLIKYYNSIGFINETNWAGNTILSGKVGNIIEKILNY
jgi:pantothenate kinase